MKLDFNLNLSQDQKLIMTQQMQQSIKLLQMSTYDLREHIEQEYAENPMLEGDFEIIQDAKKDVDKIDYKEMIKYLEFDSYGSNNFGDYSRDDDDVSPFNFISEKESLSEYINNQILEHNEDELIKSIASYMVYNLDHRGYLDNTLENICEELNVSLEIGQVALDFLQELEPYGIGARNLRECLKIQLINTGRLDENLEAIIDEYLEFVGDNKYLQIAKKLNIAPKEAQDYGDIIKTLEPKPSRGFYTGDEVKFIIPDASIRKIDGEYFVIMNDGVIPRLSISNIYKDILHDQCSDRTKEYVKNKLNSAMFLIKSIEQRKSTLLRILEKIVEKQIEYFEKGQKYLKPMTLKEMAEELEIHESTVSRAVKDKYVLIGTGTVKIKDLFSTGISTSNDSGEDVAVVNIKKGIKVLIDSEDKKKPLSDQIICDKLNENNLNISRRTVAKYREEMGIKSSSKRKRIE